jgi:hypothetical protein
MTPTTKRVPAFGASETFGLASGNDCDAPIAAAGLAVS